MPRNTERTQKAMEMLAQGMEPKQIGEQLGTKTIGWIHRLMNKNKNKANPQPKAKASTKLKAKTNGNGKRPYTRRIEVQAVKSPASGVVWKAKSGGTALFATQEVARTYLGTSAQVVPVQVFQ